MIAPLVHFANGDPTLPKATEFLLNLGIISSVLTAVTGFVDWKRLPKHTPLWKTGLIHMIVTGVATVLFIVAKNLNEPAFAEGTVTTTGYALLLAAYALMAFGGWLGGKLVFVFGYRVLAAPGSGEGGAG